MENDEQASFEDNQGKIRVSGDINFELNLQLQINRINQMLASPEMKANDMFVWSVRALREMLSPYYDEEFRNEFDVLIKNKKDKDVSDFSFSIEVYGMLCRLMNRLNLLLEKSKRGRFQR